MMGGLAYMTGPPGQPLRAGTSIIDIGGGMFGIIGVLTALYSRQQTGKTLTRWAIEDKKPLLGLCRGSQVINVALGGTLYQDLEAECPGAIKHDYFPTAGFARDYLAHPVSVVAGSRLAGILDRTEVQVNSMHHQGVKALAPGLVISARAPDGLIEGIESSNGHFMVGVQWHPESLVAHDDGMRRLFSTFIAASAAR
jgi:putative glutamine amidotransferase